MIKMVATDVDGTLLDGERRISAENLNAIATAVADGITVCLASGRLYTTLKPIAEAAGLTCPMVMCNGAYAETAAGLAVVDECVGKAAQVAVLEYAKLHNVHVNVYEPKKVTVSQNGEFYAMYQDRVKIGSILSDPDSMQALRATKLIFIDHPNEIQRYYAHFRPLAQALGVDLTTSEPEYLEFLPKGANKGTALDRLSAHLGINQAEVAAIGDYYNDMEMVKWAGLGGAVANAVPELLAAADVVVASNEEAGLSEFLGFIKNRNAMESRLSVC